MVLTKELGKQFKGQAIQQISSEIYKHKNYIKQLENELENIKDMSSRQFVDYVFKQ